MLTEANWDDWIKSGLAAAVIAGTNCYYKKPLPPETVAVYEKLIGHVRAVQLTKLADQTEATGKMLSHFDDEYRQIKRRRRLARFEDTGLCT